MSDRPPFEAAHNCICAYGDTPILEFYKGYFEAVYIILHPFYRLDEEKNVSQVLTWNEVLPLAGFKSIDQMDVALRTNIGGLREKWENKKDAHTLQRTAELHDLWIPSEGNFQQAIEQDMLMSLQEQGHNYIFIADGWGYERKLAYIKDLIDGKDDTHLTWGAQMNWYTNHNEILYTTHWDSHFTLLCSNRETIESILAKHPFEGFYCDKKTEVYWSTSPEN